MNFRKEIGMWNTEYNELFSSQYDDETLSYDNDMMQKEIESIIGA